MQHNNEIIDVVFCPTALESEQLLAKYFFLYRVINKKSKKISENLKRVFDGICGELARVL